MPTAEWACPGLANVGNNAFLRVPKFLFPRELRQRFGKPSPISPRSRIWERTIVKDAQITSK